MQLATWSFMLLQSSIIMYDDLYVKQNKGNSTRNIRQCLTETNFRKHYTFIQLLNVDVLSTSSLEIL